MVRRNIAVTNRSVSMMGRSVSIGSPGRLIDNFEDVPYGPYDSGDDLKTFYEVDTEEANWSDYNDAERSTRGTTSGEYVLEGTDDSYTGHIHSSPADGLPNYPQKGDIVEGFVWNNDTDGARLYIGVLLDSSGRGIWGQARFTDSSLRIHDERKEEYDAKGRVSEPFYKSAGEGWYILRIELHDGSGPKPENEVIAKLWSTTSKYEKDELIAEAAYSRIIHDDGNGFGLATNRDTGLNAIDAVRIVGDVSEL